MLAMLSIATSTLTVAYTATTITYDQDVSVENRRRSPKLWGMIADEGRGRTFFLMVLISTFQLVAKVLSTALLATTNATWLVLWLSADLLLFFLYKIIRSDLFYYVPVEGVLLYVVAFSQRLLIKIVVDFTGIALMRNPYGT